MRVIELKLGSMQTNCYILADDKGEAAVIDPGYTPDEIAAVLAREGLVLRYILLTHGHFDHIGGIRGLKARFPEAVVAIGEADAAMLVKAGTSPMTRRFPPEVADYTGLSAELLLEEGAVLPLGSLSVEVLHTPGHTRGGVCYRVEDTLFTGDTLFREEVGRCDLEGGDYGAMLRSVKRLAELPGDYKVLPGHEAGSTLMHERAYNPYVHKAYEA